MEIANKQEAVEETPAQKAPTLQDIKKQFFSGEQLGEAETAIQNAINAADAIEGAKVIWNFDPAKDMEEGYGIIIQPINQRDPELNKTVVVGVGIGAVPEYAKIADVKTGADWIRQTVENAIQAKFANAIRPKADGESAASVPFSVDDFITSQRAEGVLVAYRKLAKSFIELLRKKGLKLMNEQLLRQVLQSAAFAEQHFPSIKQEVWDTILGKMVTMAEKENLAPGMLVEWKATRATAGLPEVQDIDVTDFDF